MFRFGGSELDIDTREIRVDGTPVHVEPQVFDVLTYLVRQRHRMVPKSELLDQVWGDQFVSEAALTSRIKSARAALGDDGSSQRLIRTLRGRGYRFVGDVETIEGAPAQDGSPSGRRSRAALVAPRGPLIGRDADLEALGRALRRYRAITICGPGGAGKSTLALALARQGLGHPGADGPDPDVVFAELAPARDGPTMVRAVAEAVGVQGTAATDARELAASLGHRELLLVLDNCEHLLDTCAELVDSILDSGPSARILATSREPLRVDGEAVHQLGSLGGDAAALFIERATAALGALDLTADDLRVVELCERLDGLPLAIELAAAQLRHLTLDELLGRIDSRLTILVGGRPRAGERHSALAATIEWSYQLLSVPSRQLFDRLGVFPASFDLPSLQAVTAEHDAVPVTHLIGDLVAKNLVVHDHSTGRYHLLETIRLFAAQRLAAAGAGAELTERLRRHVVERARAVPRHHAWLSASLAAASRDDIENVRLAFDASIACGALGDAVDVALAISTLWRNAVSFAEGRRWVAALDRAGGLEVRDRLWLRIIEADLGLGSGDPVLMVSSATLAIELGREVDEPAGVVIATVYRSLLVDVPQRAIDGLEEARDQARDIGADELERLATAFLVVARLVAGSRDSLEAETLSVATSNTSTGYDQYISLWAAWVTALADRDGPGLRRWMDAQLDNVVASGLQENWLTMFCHALTRIGEGAPYLPHLGQARRRAEAEGRRADADCVFALAFAAACKDEPERSAELLGASGTELFHDTANFVHHLIVRDLVVRPRLDPDTFHEATERGRTQELAGILSDHGL